LSAKTKDSGPAIRALAPWYGAKRILAPRIVEALGPHTAYWEPFCGSMAVLLAKPRATMETVNDLHGDLVNLARVVADDRLGPKLYRRLRRTLMDEVLFAEALRWIKAEPDFASAVPDLDRAYWFFVQSWMGRNGLCGTKGYNRSTPCVRYSQSGGHSSTRWAAAVRSIPQWRERLRGVAILRRDGLEILARIEDTPGTAIYVDPPYLAKSCLYQHDFDATQHALLAVRLERFRRARVVVSYYDDRRLTDLYPPGHWHYERIEMRKNLSSSGGKVGGQPGPAKASNVVEVLLCNQPPLAALAARARVAATLFDRGGT